MRAGRHGEVLQSLIAILRRGVKTNARAAKHDCINSQNLKSKSVKAKRPFAEILLLRNFSYIKLTTRRLNFFIFLFTTLKQGPSVSLKHYAVYVHLLIIAVSIIIYKSFVIIFVTIAITNSWNKRCASHVTIFRCDRRHSEFRKRYFLLLL